MLSLHAKLGCWSRGIHWYAFGVDGLREMTIGNRPIYSFCRASQVDVSHLHKLSLTEPIRRSIHYLSGWFSRQRSIMQSYQLTEALIAAPLTTHRAQIAGYSFPETMNSNRTSGILFYIPAVVTIERHLSSFILKGDISQCPVGQWLVHHNPIPLLLCICLCSNQFIWYENSVVETAYKSCIANPSDPWNLYPLYGFLWECFCRTEHALAFFRNQQEMDGKNEISLGTLWIVFVRALTWDVG